MENGSSDLKTKKFISLLVPNQRHIHAYILYLVPHQSDADDILQDTLAEMWNKFDDFREGTNFIAWGITIARYKILSFRQKNKASKVLFSDRINELIDTECRENIDSVKYEIDILKKCMDKLPGRHKKYLLMRYEQSMTFRAIAAQVGITMQAVYKSFCRIHAQLAQCVQLSLRSEAGQ